MAESRKNATYLLSETNILNKNINMCHAKEVGLNRYRAVRNV